MKKIITTAVLALIALVAFGQGRSISKLPKITTPYITEAGDTLAVGMEIQLLDGTGDRNTFRYVQLLNKFNEPIQPATSKAAMKKQPIVFFKEEDGVMYAFTDFFCINIEAALYKEEIRVVRKKTK